MENERDLGLASRKEETREVRQVTIPLQFTLAEIKQHFEESINAVKKQYDVAQSLSDAGDLDGCKNIWRSQVVFAEGIMDFYIHEMSKYCLFRMLNREWEKSQQYEHFQVPMEIVEKAALGQEPKDWFFEHLNKRFSRDVFLSSENMKQQLNLIGIGFVPAMVRAFPGANEEVSKKIGSKTIAALFERRNAIAHQNDRDHASAKQNDISKEFVEEYIGSIEKIVNAIHSIAEEKS